MHLYGELLVYLVFKYLIHSTVTLAAGLASFAGVILVWYVSRWVNIKVKGVLNSSSIERYPSRNGE